MRIGEEKEIAVQLVPHTLDTLEQAAKEKDMKVPALIRVIINEWALKYEQLKNEKDR